MITQLRRRLAELFVAVLIVTGVSVTSNASILFDALKNGVINGLDDADADIGVQLGAGGTYSVSSGSLAVGDFIVAGIDFARLQAPTFADTNFAGAGNHVTAFSILKIDTLGPFGGGLSSFSFVAPTVAEWNAIVDDVFGAANAALKKSTAGGMVKFFQDVTSEFDFITPPATLAASALTIHTGGTDAGEIGFTGAANGDGNITPNGSGEGWIATGPSDPSLGSSTPLFVGIPGTSFTAGLTRLSGWDPVISFQPLPTFFGGTADFVSGGTLLGYGDGPFPPGTAVGPWQIASEARVSFVPVLVPEPVSLLCWMGLAMFFSSCFCRYRR